MVISNKKAKFSQKKPNELITKTSKRNANSEGDEFSSYSEVWCQSEGEGDITMELKEKLEESEFKIQMTMRGR